MATAAQRHHAVAIMDLCHSHSGQFRYPPHDQRTQLEAYDWGLSEAQMTTLLMHGHAVEFDCSDLSSWVYRQIGCWPRSRGPGYTGTWLELGLPRYQDGKLAGLAAPCVFGIGTRPTGHHMGLVYDTDHEHGNPLIFEHGSPGIHLTRLRDIVARQTAEGYPGYTFLNVSRL